MVLPLQEQLEGSYRSLFNANSLSERNDESLSTLILEKNLPNAASPLANSAVNIRLAAVAATVPIANEPIYNENEETWVTEAVIRTSLAGVVLFLESAGAGLTPMASFREE